MFLDPPKPQPGHRTKRNDGISSRTTRVSTKGLKRSNFPNLRAFYTLVSKSFFKEMALIMDAPLWKPFGSKPSIKKGTTVQKNRNEGTKNQGVLQGVAFTGVQVLR